MLCLDACAADFTNVYLPASNFAGPTAFGFWDDLVITPGTSQGVYYNVIGSFPN